MACEDYVRIAELLGFVKGMGVAFVLVGVAVLLGFLIVNWRRK